MTPAARGTQRFCTNCGAKVTKAHKFCPECGEALQPAAEPTEELAPSAAGPRTRKSTAARTQKLPPPMPPPTPKTAPLPPPPPPRAGGTLAWPAWAGAGAAGVLVIATGLPWFGGGFSVDSYDLPFTLLFSNTAQGGLPLGVVFVVAGAAALTVALIKPDARTLRIGFLSAGAASSLFMIWYLVRVLTELEGASLFEAFSFGAWLALLSSIAILVGGVLLSRRSSAAA